ncbi:unnamed protein product [Rotaria sp. Silwood2]|nr:unnamed protein product [Rotaria sp. Silwood2]CAF2869157.1 unnamed protein product [Rotaria sp. Silwood2]CAF3246097.1 unnamed protein product [Rotaria sp. Silwood2]CAF3894401.1 unnamed protein product [Rotaria sp. Silwood2]CAF4545973.1 unnamed protein product [Rotaria sp. Silwood2]
MTSSYYPITTDNFFDNTQSQSITPMSHYSSYQMSNTTKKNYHDDDDDDLEALRTAALKTLYSNKRKNTYDHSPIHRNSRSSSRSYSSSSSRSSYSRSSISRSYSSSSLSSISSNSLDKNDKDYRFETKDKQTIGDIDERFPQDILNNNDDDALIVNCPIQDDDLLIQDEQQTLVINHSKEQILKKPSHYNEHNHNKLSSKETERRKNEDTKKSSSIKEHPVSITVKLNSDDFDLRQLIKKRRTNESLQNNNQRIVQILPKDNQSNVHKTIDDRISSKRLDKNQSLKKYHKH